MTSQADIRQSIIDQSDQCVLCGLCLEHCPTYRVTQNEAESPRGRISLLRALATGELTVDDKFNRHIDQCTGCLKCESVCPAKVSYSTIIDQGRALQLKLKPAHKQFSRRLILNALNHQGSVQLGKQLSAAASKCGVKSSLSFASTQKVHPASLEPEAPCASVTLFSGCTGQAMDRETQIASRQLLAKLNIRTVLPQQHLCCGATFQHSGSPQKANHTLQKTMRKLDEIDHYPMISIATGCAAQLHKNAKQFTTSSNYQHFNILDYLKTLHWPKTLKVNGLPARVFLHTPCTAEQSASDMTAASALLDKIPELEVVISQPHYGCCGAGGLNLLTQTHIGKQLVSPIIDQALNSGCKMILTSNIGCQLQLRRDLRQRNQTIPVLHPVTLLNKQFEHA